MTIAVTGNSRKIIAVRFLIDEKGCIPIYLQEIPFLWQSAGRMTPVLAALRAVPHFDQKKPKTSAAYFEEIVEDCHKERTQQQRKEVLQINNSNMKNISQ